MNLLKYAFPLAIATGLGMTSAYAANADGKSDFRTELEESDMQVLQNFINSKRKIPLADKSKNLKISGEVHFEWNYYTEKIRGKDVRTYVFREQEVINDDVYFPGQRLPVGDNDFDVQVDMFFDWDSDRTWARTHVRYDNSAGQDDNQLDKRIDPGGYHGSGSKDNLNLKEAYVGYEIFKKENSRLTIELGRRGNIYKAFYSELQFAGRLDGVILKYTDKWRNYTGYHVQWAGFVVDERATHWAWAFQVGLDNLKNSGVDVKYSFVDWQKPGRNRYGVKNPNGFRFKVSQISLQYHLHPECLGKQPVELCVGFLVNHIPSKWTYINKAKKSWNYESKRKYIGVQNTGAFASLQLREIHREGDWLVKFLAAYCEAQCIPDNDVRNLGTGNFLRQSFTSDGRGNVNWKGYGVKFGYAITDNLVIETQYDHTWSIDNDIAGTHGFTRYMIETTYSF